MANILIVDDDEADLLGLAAVLESDGHEVLLARDGDEALEIFLTQRIHLVVTDMVMPGRDGLSLISALRSVDPGVAVIAVSGKSPSQLEASMTFGAKKVLTKPVDRSDLLDAVREAFGGNGGGAT
jgi:CheY-like chemotaxis protein